MKISNRTVALTIVVAILFALMLSSFASSVGANHCCVGCECAICNFIKALDEVCRVVTAVVCLFSAALASMVAICLHVRTRVTEKTFTPVYKKVKLLD